MSNNRVKIIIDDSGEKIAHPKWCFVFDVAGGSVAFCSGQYFGLGQSSVVYEQGIGDITCPDCRDKIKQMKKVKL